MSATRIEWADKVWNPVTGCTPISAGCEHCYAKRMATRLAGRVGYPADDPFRVTLHSDKMGEPRTWRKPQRVFVCSMGDLFHDAVPYEWIRDVFQMMMFTAPQHTYMILTKRPERLMKWMLINYDPETMYRFRDLYPHIWLGVTAENQRQADIRVPILLSIPATVHFVSVEPMLGRVSFVGWPVRPEWIIAGPETGPGARAMDHFEFQKLMEESPCFFDKRIHGERREFPI